MEKYKETISETGWILYRKNCWEILKIRFCFNKSDVKGKNILCKTYF